ncbi:MAG TPA: hypothetical protein VGM76_01350 [Lacipirellulaceae bacterium]|jgi:hypothetical protein
MQAFVSKLMVGLVLAQAISGWCCHRPCHCLDGEAADVCAELTADECCHNDHSTLTLHASAHCQCHECLGFCTYVAAAKSQLVRPQTSFGFDLAAANPGLANTQWSVEQRAGNRESDQLGPPVRLHLLHQSLLI